MQRRRAPQSSPGYFPAIDHEILKATCDGASPVRARYRWRTGMDHFLLRAKGYVRYVDDVALFHDDPGSSTRGGCASTGSWKAAV